MKKVSFKWICYEENIERGEEKTISIFFFISKKAKLYPLHPKRQNNSFLPFQYIIMKTVEENDLILRFGDDYKAYQKKTGAFFPKRE